MPAERAQKLFCGLDAQAMEIHAPSADNALKRNIDAFTGIDENRDYRAMYRAAFEYHDQHNPPRIDREYWQTHEPGKASLPQVDLDYWGKAARDICEISKQFCNDKFMQGLLCAVYDELAREYEVARQQAAK